MSSVHTVKATSLPLRQAMERVGYASSECAARSTWTIGFTPAASLPKQGDNTPGDLCRTS